MRAAPSVLFAIGQHGAANFFLPVWRQWSAVAPAWRWTILLADQRIRDCVRQSGSRQAAALDVASVERSFAEQRPELVITSTSRHPAERAAYTIAKRNGTATIQLIDGHYDYAMRLRDTNGNDAAFPDRILVPDALARAGAEQEGIPRSRLSVVGHPAWEDVPYLPPGDAGRAVFISQPIASDYGRLRGYTEREAFALTVEAMTDPQCPYRSLLLAAHPRERWDPSDLPSGATVASSSDAAVAACDIVLGMFSSLLMHCFLSGRRTISVQPRGATSDWCVLSRNGLIPKVVAAKDISAACAAPRGPVEEVRSWYAGSVGRVTATIGSML